MGAFSIRPIFPEKVGTRRDCEKKKGFAIFLSSLRFIKLEKWLIHPKRRNHHASLVENE
jgi:hypothetical protein